MHGKVNLSSIMLERAGNAKLIDIRTAFALEDAPLRAGLHRAHGS